MSNEEEELENMVAENLVALHSSPMFIQKEELEESVFNLWNVINLNEKVMKNDSIKILTKTRSSEPLETLPDR
jgi:hypothetical protein